MARITRRTFVAAAAATVAAPAFAAFPDKPIRIVAPWGNGSTSHIGMEIIMRSVGIEMNHVPFTGQAPGLLAVQGGQVDTMLLTAGGADASAKGGLVKMLGLAAENRLPLMASTPTL